MSELSGSRFIPMWNTKLWWIEVWNALSVEQKSSCSKLLKSIHAEDYFALYDETLVLPILLLNKNNTTFSFYWSDINLNYENIKLEKETSQRWNINFFLEQICKEVPVGGTQKDIELYQIWVKIPTWEVIMDILMLTDRHDIPLTPSRTSSVTKRPNVPLMRKSWSNFIRYKT